MKLNKLLKRAATAVLSLSLLTAPVLADTIGGATVTTYDTGLNLREKASTASEALTVIPNGSFLLVEEALGGWYKVAYNGMTGYVSANYTRFSETLDGSYVYAAETGGTDVNLRQGAGVGTEISRSYVESGRDLTVLGVSGSWLHVMDADGVTGYIRSDLVNYSLTSSEGRLGQAAATQAAAVSTGQQIAAAAANYLGCSYTWGGMSPETGFDCSGFVNYIYNQFGYKLERVAQNIFYSNGYSVSYDQLQPGDLLFFGSGPDDIGHVGLYVGNGEMIHAGTYSTGVVRTNLVESYYVNSFVGARRVAG